MEIARKEHREDYSDLPQDALTLIRSYVIEKIAGRKAAHNVLHIKS